MSDKRLLIFLMAFLPGLNNLVGQIIPFEDSIAIRSILDRAKQVVLADEDQVLSEIMLDSVWERLSLYDAENTELHFMYWQTKAGLAYYRARLPEAVELFKKSAHIAEQYYPAGDIRLAPSYHNLGLMSMEIEQYDEAIFWINKALELRRQKLVPNDPLLAGTVNVLGNIYYELQVFDAAEQCFKEAEQIYKQHPDRQHDMAIIYMNLGNLTADLGDYERSIQYYRQSLLLRQALFPAVHNRIARCHYLLADVYQKTFRYEEAEAAYLEAIYQFEHVEFIDSALLASAYEYYASLLAITDRAEQAIQYQNKCMQIRQAQEWSSAKYLATGYHTMSELYYNIGDYATCLKVNDQALALLREFYKTELNSFTIESTALRAKALIRIDRMEEAIAVCSELLHLITTSDHPIKEKHYFIRQLYAARAWAEFKLAQKKKDKLLLTKSLQDYDTFERLLLADRYNYTRPHTQAFHFRLTREVFEQAIEAYTYAFEWHQTPSYLERAFYFSEQARALLLRQSAQQALAWKSAEVPIPLLTVERDILSGIQINERLRDESLNEQYADEADVAEQAAYLSRLQNQIDSLYQELDEIQDLFKNEYPEYYARKYELQVSDLTYIQQQLLKPGQLILEYFVGEQHIYAFQITQESLRVTRIAKDFPLESWVADMRLGLTSFHSDPALAMEYEAMAKRYTESAKKLYDKLIAAPGISLPEKIIVIPDQQLNYLPFDVLLSEAPTQPVNWSQHAYLIKKHDFSYAFSATMLRFMLQPISPQESDSYFVGFAPVYDGDTSALSAQYGHLDEMRRHLRPLPWSGEELFRIAKIMDGKAFYGEAATTMTFFEQAEQAFILHLATHAQADDQVGDRSFMAFSGVGEYTFILAKDIYALHLHAGLVTLSACETGFGELQDGEGVISLSRAFAYAGAQSVVASLWSVSDAKTKDLMLRFYQYLRKGWPKDQALRQAKLDLLAQYKGQAAHPFFWAGFVAFGNMEALPAKD